MALAKVRGLISAVGYVTATFSTVEYRMDTRWPENEELLSEKTPVYLALENSFEPDPGRMLTQEQADTMQGLALEYRKLTGREPEDGGDAHDPAGGVQP